MRTFSEKSAFGTASVKCTTPGSAHFGRCREANSVLHLQRTIGNQAVQRLIRANPSAAAIQTKLTVNKPGDEYEQEAERVADQVMRMVEPAGSPAPDGVSSVQQIAGGGLVQRLSAEISPSLADVTVVGEDAEQGAVQTLRSPAHQSGTEVVSKQVLNSAEGGLPLDSNVRRFMETRFGRDFSRVQVHTDDRAAALSDSLQARAFTYGPHIYFGAREYRPETEAGMHVLAHELTHVVQQGASDSRGHMPIPLATSQSAGSPTKVQRLKAHGKLLAQNVAPWGAGGPTGRNYEASTDSGTTVTGWEAYSPWQIPLQYWCHGHSTNSYADFGYSVYSGPDFANVIKDEWTNIAPDQTKAGDIAVWTSGFDHSARFTQPVVEKGHLSPDASMLSTKNGQRPVATMSLTAIIGVYGSSGIAVYRRK